MKSPDENQSLKTVLRKLLKKARRVGCDVDPSVANLLASNVPSFDRPTITLGTQTARPITPDRLRALLQEIDDQGEFPTREEAQKFLNLLGVIFWGVELQASPQAENGHIDIANETAETLAGTNFCSYESRVLWALWRMTYGWHKKVDRISITQFQKITGLDRRNVVRTLLRLIKRKIIVKIDNGFIKTYGFQKNYTQWKNRGERDNKSKSLSIETTQIGAIQTPTKEKKEKRYCVEGSDELRLAVLLLEEIRKNQPTFKEPSLQTWAKEVDLMVRRDGRTPDRIREVILWCQHDPFWWKNVLSASKLRKQFDRLEAEMASPKGKAQVKEIPRVEYRDLTGGGRA